MRYLDVDPTGLEWQRRTYLDVLDELAAANDDDQPKIVAIDGRSGSGKSTLARGLAALDPHTVVIQTDGLADSEPLRQQRLHRLLPQGLLAGPAVVFLEGVGSARRESRAWLDSVIWVHHREHRGQCGYRFRTRAHGDAESKLSPPFVVR